MYKQQRNMRNIIIINIVIFCLIMSGWFMNVYKLTKCDFKQPYKTEIIRFIGLVPPIGAIVGWMDFGK